MDLIDEQGRLFGLVNVIDALVVLLVLAVLVAGIALVNPFADAGEPATRYATVELSDQPAYVAERISVNDTVVDAAGNITVTDVYVTDAGADTTVFARVKLNGTLAGPDDTPDRTFVYEDEPFRPGRSLGLNTTDYTAVGVVTNVSTTGRSLPTERMNARIQTTVPTDTADTISTGDTYTVAGEPIATVESVQTLPTDDPNRQLVTLGLSMTTIRQNGARTFAGRPTTVGASIPFRTNAYALTGNITARGSSDVTVRRTPLRFETNVSTDTARLVSPGDTYRVSEATVATIRSVERFPTESPRRQYLAVGVEVATLADDGGTPTFAGQSLSVGSTIPFRTDAYDLSGTITGLNSTEVATERTAVRLEATVPTATADAISTGDTYRIDGETVATVEEVAVFPNGSTDTRHVALGVELKTLVQGSDRTFAGRPTTVGASLPFRTEAYTLTGEVTARGSTALDVQPVDVVLRTTVAPEVADRIDAGDAFEVNGRTVAELETVTEYPRAGTNRRTMVLGIRLQTLADGTTRTFARTPVRLGQSIPFRTDAYDLSGPIVATGALDPPGEPTTTTAVVEVENVRPAVADEIDAGDTEVVRGRRLARVASVRSDNATVILTSESGEIFAREHPRNRDVTMTVALETRRTPDGLRFHGRPLEVGTSVTLELGDVTVSGRVTRLRA